MQTAIVPGSSFAVVALHMVSLHHFNTVLAAWPRQRAVNYVDDIAMAAHGASSQAVRTIVGAPEGQLELRISKEDGGALGTSLVAFSNR